VVIVFGPGVDAAMTKIVSGWPSTPVAETQTG
jgi:hypothetical protein